MNLKIAKSLDLIVPSAVLTRADEVIECVPKPLTSGSRAKGRYGKQDFVYLADDDVYRCPAGETLTPRFTSVEDGMNLYVYWTTVAFRRSSSVN